MGQETRQKILGAAARLFHEQGYAATGVATILREAGVNSGSLYHFFPGKEALLHAVLDRYRDLLEPEVLTPVEQAEPDPVARIFRLLDWYRERMVATGCRLGCPIGNLALEVSDSHPAVRRAIDINFEAWTAGIKHWLDEAGERIPAECDRGSLARFILTVMEGGLIQARAAGNLEPFDASVRVLRDHIRRLLAEGADEARKGETR